MFDFQPQEERDQTKYPWNEYEVNLILGSFFWGYICTEIPGGRLAEVIGTRKVFGYSMLVSSFITLLTPLAGTFGYAVVAALRVILGFMLVRRYFSTDYYNHDKCTRPLRENNLTGDSREMNLSSVFLFLFVYIH